MAISPVNVPKIFGDVPAFMGIDYDPNLKNIKADANAQKVAESWIDIILSINQTATIMNRINHLLLSLVCLYIILCLLLYTRYYIYFTHNN